MGNIILLKGNTTAVDMDVRRQRGCFATIAW